MATLSASTRLPYLMAAFSILNTQPMATMEVRSWMCPTRERPIILKWCITQLVMAMAVMEQSLKVMLSTKLIFTFNVFMYHLLNK